MRNLAALVVILFLTSGCAIGQKTNYHEGETQFAEFTKDRMQTLYIGFYERRPYVLSGEKDVSFTGLVRSLYGIPYARHTESGNALSFDLTNFLVRSLNSQGYNTKPIHLSLRQDIEPVLTSVVNDKNELAMIYTFREWKTDSMHREVFIYDLTLDVYDSNGHILASTTDSGRRKIDKNFHLGSAIKELLDRINRQPSIQKALSS